MLSTVAIALIAGGCGPTRTAGTRGVAAKQLAVLSIPQLPKDVPVQIEAVAFDDGGKEEKYTIGKGREFYLQPGQHSAGFELVARVPDIEDAPKWLKWVIPGGGKKTIKIPGPKKVPLGAMSAGKKYELAPPTFDSIDDLLQEGRFSLVREKEK